jgi:hypothetical protein
MSLETLFILILLNIAHFLGDFTPLNKWMIAAKRYGKPTYLVLAHGAVNGALYMIAALFFTALGGNGSRPIVASDSINSNRIFDNVIKK